jgi:hypothetical protein
MSDRSRTAPRKIELSSRMRFGFVLLALVCSSQAAAAQLTVALPDGSSRTISAAELRAMPHTSGTAVFHTDTVAYEGVDLRDVLRAAGLAPVDSLRGRHLRRVVLLVGADNYSAAIAQADIDPSIGARRVIVVDREDGAALPRERGPQRALVVGDHRPSRAVRQLVRIAVIDLPEPR